LYNLSIERSIIIIGTLLDVRSVLWWIYWCKISR